MNVTTRLGLFALAALTALGIGYGVGRLVSDGNTEPAPMVQQMGNP